MTQETKTFQIVQTPKQQNAMGGQFETVALLDDGTKHTVLAGSEDGAYRQLKDELKEKGYTGPAALTMPKADSSPGEVDRFTQSTAYNSFFERDTAAKPAKAHAPAARAESGTQ